MREGTYGWRLVAEAAIVAHDVGDGRKLIAAPSAPRSHHRLCEVYTTEDVGTVGHLRYVSNFPQWGRVEFERGPCA